MRNPRIFFLLCCSFFSFLLSATPSDTGTVGVTPEPNMVILLAAGLTGIGVAAWRRNRKR